MRQFRRGSRWFGPRDVRAGCRVDPNAVVSFLLVEKDECNMTETRAFQDYYPDEMSVCYGCGRLNSSGLHVKSYWKGDETICRFHPRPEHTAIAGFVYGGLIASVIDCHGTGSAAAAAYRAEGREMGSLPCLRFVTAHLAVDYLKPTPIDAALELRGTIKLVRSRKVVIEVEVWSKGELTARGEVTAVRVPESMIAPER